MPTEIRTILAAVDFGEASARALELAGALAETLDARLRVLHAEALDAPPYFTRAQVEAMEGEAREMRLRALEYLREFVRPRVPVPYEPVVELRAPTDAILHAAAGADLVVMGTHGRRGPSRWWLGSVAERVLRETPVPLLVMHDAGPPAGAAAVFREGMLLQPEGGASCPRTRRLADLVAHAFHGTVFTPATADPRAARAESGATWVAVPAPTPRTGRWLSTVGEPLVTGCRLPVLFVPEQGGESRS